MFPDIIKRITRRDILRVAVYAVVFLLLLELAARYYEYGPACFSYRMMNSLDSLEPLVRPSSVEGVPYEFKPNLRTLYHMKPFVTNAAGLREDTEYPLAKPSGTFRAVVIGASNAMGHGLERKDMFDKIVERRLNGRRDGARYEFINFAFESYNAKKCWNILEKKALAYGPDLVLFCTPTRGEMRRYPENVRPPKKGSYRYHFFSSHFWALVKNSILFQPARPYENIGYSEEQLREMDEVYGRLSGLGIPACIVILKYGEGDPSDTAAAQIRALAEKHRLYFLDTWPRFDKRIPLKKYLVFGDDPHPNETASAFFADAITAFLAEKGLERKKAAKGPAL